jgi:hypothetical protein
MVDFARWAMKTGCKDLPVAKKWQLCDDFEGEIDN